MGNMWGVQDRGRRGGLGIKIRNVAIVFWSGALYGGHCVQSMGYCRHLSCGCLPCQRSALKYGPGTSETSKQNTAGSNAALELSTQYPLYATVYLSILH